MATTTGVARVSLATGSAPVTRTNHTIRVRARTTAGAGTIRAALYEGATNVTDTAPGYLESSALTTSLAEYILPIADADAATITSYANLELQLWGFAAAGGAIVFEISNAILVVPVAGTPKTTAVARISLAAGSTPATRTNHVVAVRARKTNAAHTATLGIDLYEGASKRTVQELTQNLTASLADYSLAITNADAATITSYSNLELRIRGFSTPGDAATFEVARVTLSIPAAGATTAPSAPQSVLATGGDSQVALTWSAPASDGGSAITAYKIYRGGSPGAEVLFASPAGTGTSYTDSTAVNGTPYYYKVSAVNAIGESALSSEAAATPSAASLVRTFKRFYGPSLLSNAAATLYTCPASTAAVVRHVHVSNPTGSPVDFTLSIGASAAATRIWDGIPIAADDVLDHYQEFTLSAAEIIQGFAGSAAVLNLTIDGYEVGIAAAEAPIYPSNTLLPSDTSP